VSSNNTTVCSDIPSFLDLLRRENELCEINVPVDPYLEAAEIHRRVIAEGGPALLFKNIIGSPYPLATNLFGTVKRVNLAFGPRPGQFIREAAKLPETMLPPTIAKLWGKRKLLFDLTRVGTATKQFKRGDFISEDPKLMSLPLLTTWQEDGGPFVTLPLVYTEHPETHIPNLGMYRLQRFDDQTTGFHAQIGKGGGFHLQAARDRGESLPVNVFIGGPPALILSAIAPLPENVSELLFASLVLGRKLPLMKNPYGELPLAGTAEFALIGEVLPNELRPEGPFGDHYGYYSLQHDYPVFRCKKVIRKKNPICTATVVGKPRQEDFYLGDYLQSVLSPLFPLVMPAVNDLWSYGETGYHSLAAAVVKQRYKREAMVSAFRILGEGQLSLTKFLLVLDKACDLKNFKAVLEHVLERADFRTDLYIFSNLAMDTLDYTGPKVNEGSKGVLLGIGEPFRSLPRAFAGEVPRGAKNVAVFCPGCLVIDGPAYSSDNTFPEQIAASNTFADWPLVILVDDAKAAASSTQSFLWTTFTRFEPGADITAKDKSIIRNHVSYTPPIVIDARKKPNLPEELECDEATKKKVSLRWKEYF
jgi:UbiD family decarboxylase